jgi:hypothetical protein
MYWETFTLLPVAKNCSKEPESTVTAETKDGFIKNEIIHTDRKKQDRRWKN